MTNNICARDDTTNTLGTTTTNTTMITNNKIRVASMLWDYTIIKKL